MCDDLDVSFIPMPLIDEGYTNSHSFEIRKWKDVKTGFTHFAEGDLAVAKITPCFENKKSVIFHDLKNGFGAGTTELHIVRVLQNSLNAHYILWNLKTNNFIADGVNAFSGAVGQKRIGREFIANYLLAIPPRVQQDMIVKTIDDAFAAITEIEKSSATIDSVKALLKSKILELAIQGKLVPQDENDEPASVLLERIRAERKAKLGKKYVESYIFKGDDNCYYEKVGNTSKKISDEMSFDLPFGWCWITLKEIATITSGKTPKNEQITDLGNIPYFKVGDMNLPGNEIFMEVVQYYVNDCYTGITFPKDSFIFPKNGGALLTNKKRILKQESLVDLNTGVLIPSSAVNNEFMFYLFSTVDFTKNYKGSTIPTIDNEMIGNIVFALPPIEEQFRIVQKIKVIMSILKSGV